jgi:Ca2+-binding EF-hand superfamily protein
VCAYSRASSKLLQMHVKRETSRHDPDSPASSSIARLQSSTTAASTAAGSAGASLMTPSSARKSMSGDGSSGTNPDHMNLKKSTHCFATPADSGDLAAVVSVECRKLKGLSPLAKLDARCVVSAGEYEYSGKRKHFKWEAIGETETVQNSHNPVFASTVEVAYNMTRSKLLKFDVFGSTKDGDGEAVENFHIGAYVCEVHDVLKRPGWAVDGALEKIGKVDNSHMRFEVTRHMRDVLTPAQMMDIFKSMDADMSLSLSAPEFKSAIRLMAKKGGFNMSREHEQWAWEIVDQDKTGTVNYAEFVSMMWGTEGHITVTIEDRQNVSAEKHANMLFGKYRREVKQRQGRDLAEEVETVGFDASTRASYAREAFRETQARALRLIAGVRDSQVVFDRQKERLHEIEENAFMPQIVDKTILIESRPPCKPIEWDRRAKARGIIITKEHGTAVATCNLMNENAGPCSVRSAQPLAAGVTYFELSILRDEHMHAGASLAGPYAVGLATNTMDKFDGSWTYPRETARERGGNAHPACFALVNISPPEYEARWSLRHGAPGILVHGLNNNVCTYSEAKTSDKGAARDAISNIRAQRALPRGTSYFEITIKAAGKGRGESLGGGCHVGLCSENMALFGWNGNWTDAEDPRKDEAWTLCDNYNGQLSTSVFGIKATDRMSEREMLKTLHQKFELFDKDNSGTIDWSELRDALKALSVCCMDNEITDMLTGLGVEEGGSIHFEEFVLLIRSRAATGTLFHSGKLDWRLNSHFGVGDTIGFSIDTVNGTAVIFKNGCWIGQAFSDLPEVVYPFVSLPKVGMSATISVDSSKCVNTKSDLFSGGFRKPWIEGSQFGAADRVGFLLDTDSKTCDVYKNGHYLGRAFERLPPNLFPFATLCHSGAKVCLSFPPQPHQRYYQHMKDVLADSKYFVTKDIPCMGGYMDLSETGTPCKIKLQVLAGGEHQRGERRFDLRACDIESLFDCNVLGGTVPARIVSPIVQVEQKSGPDIDEQQTKLSIPHCCVKTKGLKLVYMPGRSAGYAAHHHAWADMDATWSGRHGTCSIRDSGIFCIICLDDPLDNPDLVHVEYRLFNPQRQREGRQPEQIMNLERIPGARIPKFCCIPMGTSIDGIITLRTISTVAVCDHADEDAVDTRLPRGSHLDALSAVAYDAAGQHSGEEFSDTVCFATCRCALWISSLYAFIFEVPSSSLDRRGGLSRSEKLPNPSSSSRGMHNYLMGNTENLVKATNLWKGSPLELPFKIRSERLCDDTKLVHGTLSRRMGWNSAFSDYDWKSFSYLFDPSNGMFFEGSIFAQPNAGQLQKFSHGIPLFRQTGTRNLSKGNELRCLGKLPSLRFQAGSNPNALLRHILSLQLPHSESAGQGERGGEREQEGEGAAGMQSVSVRGSIKCDSNAIVLATGRKEDRDLFLVKLRQYVACYEDSKHVQQVYCVGLRRLVVVCMYGAG